MNREAAKRYACDRCREQKLRCSRNRQDGSTCDRCLRVGVVCVTSSGRPLGRPPLQGNDRARCHRDSNRSSFGSQRAHEPWRRERSISSPLQSLASGGTEPFITSSVLPRVPAFFNATHSSQLEESDYLHDAPSSAAFLDVSTCQHQFLTNPPNGAEFDFGNLGEVAEPHSDHSHNSTSNTDDGDSGQSESSSPNADSMALLTSVIGSISRQLVELKNQSPECWDPHLIRSALFDDENSYLTCSNIMDSNPWDSAIQITLRFVLVLQTMVPAQFSTSPPARSPLTLSLTLMLLSTYIQLGELFDTILTRISVCLQEGSGKFGPLTSVEPAPSRKTSPAQPATLQVMMIIQVFEHQLHSMERVLGLPSDCRLWSRKDAYAGILDQEQSTLLTQAVMGQAQETFGSVKRTIERILGSPRGSNLSSQTS